MLVCNDEILLCSNTNEEFAIFSYNLSIFIIVFVNKLLLEKDYWTDPFLTESYPKKSFADFKRILVTYQDSVLLCDIGYEIYSLKSPSEVKKTHKNQFRDHIKTICEGKAEQEVIFKVGDQEFPANKAILSSRCPYFKRVFSSNMMESYSNVIPINNISANAFKGIFLEIFFEK